MTNGPRVAPAQTYNGLGGVRQRRLLARIYRSRLHYLFVLPSIVLLVVFMYFPAASAIYHSATTWDGFSPATFVGLANFTAILDDPLMQAAAVNVLKLTGFAMAASVIVPLFVARLIFGLRNRRLQYLFRVLFVIPLVLPGVVILLIWQFLFDPNFGVLNQIISTLHLGQPLGWLSDPTLALYSIMLIGFPWVDGFALLIFTAGLQSIGPELLEAASIDGAGPWRRFWRVEFPLILGQVKLILILNMIWTIQNFTSIFVLTRGGPGTATMVPGLILYNEAFQSERMGYACAIGTLMFMLMLALTLINMKYVRTGTEYQPARGSA